VTEEITWPKNSAKEKSDATGYQIAAIGAGVALALLAWKGGVKGWGLAGFVVLLLVFDGLSARYGRSKARAELAAYVEARD